MEIKEVPIGSQQEDRKKVSAKVQKAVDEYLSVRSIEKDSLSSAQLDCLVKYVKSKRAEKWTLLLYVAGTITFGFIALFFYTIVDKLSADFVPTTTVIIEHDGTKTVEKPDQDSVKAFVRLCTILGVIIGGAIYSAFSSLGHVSGRIISRFLGKSQYEKIFDAFLPALKSVGIPRSQSNIERGI